jgi:hypothetical protein
MNRRNVRWLTVAVGVLIVLAGCSLGINPAEGPPNTPYKVTVLCNVKPTLYGRPLADGPPPTQVPLHTDQVGASQWTYDGVSGQYDDQYFAACGSRWVKQRFDTDAPRLYLGPVPEHISPFFPISDVEGTDCPNGTHAAVTISVDGQPTTYTATIDRYGDWVVDLPVPFGTKPMTVVATCGTVRYPQLTIPTTSTTPH